ncbi:hypothetical protein CL630_02485 [bacterium]|nr:hypothetical protein [bacterium]|tara:strand:- start:38303 stop:39457 length:1155 start_codon:yes stop_codon:yes gene_type:complete
MTPKKVLIFSLAYHPHYGGAELAVREITNRIDPQEFEFHMVTVNFCDGLPKIEKIGNILVHRIGIFPISKLNKIFFQFFAPLKAHFLHKKYHYNVIWAMMPHSTGIPSVLFNLIHGDVPYFLTLQEGDTLQDIKKSLGIFVPLYTLSFRRANFVQTISHYLKDMAREMGYKGEIKVVPNGADIENCKLQIVNFKLDELRRKLGIQNQNKILITTSRLVAKNAVDDIIKSLKYLPDTIRLLVLGIGPDEKILKKLAQDEKVSEKVHFVGFIESKKIPIYLQISDIFVRPSLSEGMGSSFVEAMAAGIPIIGTAVGGITDFLKHRETGFICEVKNPQSIAEQVNYILDPKQSDMINRIIQNACALVEENYDWDKITENMKNIFAKL